jgi:hypothetical protein
MRDEMKERKNEIRQAVLDILFERAEVTYPANQYPHLKIGVAEVLDRKSGRVTNRLRDAVLGEPEATILLEVFWDLVVEKIITIGANDMNSEVPWFRLHSEAKSRLKKAK